MYIDPNEFYHPFFTKVADYLLENDKQAVTLAEMSYLYNETATEKEEADRKAWESRAKESAEAKEEPKEEPKKEPKEQPADDDIATIQNAINDAADKPERHYRKRSKAPKVVPDSTKYADDVLEDVEYGEATAEANRDLSDVVRSILSMGD